MSTISRRRPVPRRAGRPGFGLDNGLFLPLALAAADIGAEIAAAASRSVEVVRAWFDDGAPAPVALPLRDGDVRQHLVA